MTAVVRKIERNKALGSRGVHCGSDWRGVAGSQESFPAVVLRRQPAKVVERIRVHRCHPTRRTHHEVERSPAEPDRRLFPRDLHATLDAHHDKAVRTGPYRAVLALEWRQGSIDQAKEDVGKFGLRSLGKGHKCEAGHQ